MIEMNHKTSLDVARLLEEERTNAGAERREFLAQIGAIYDTSFKQRWDRLQGNYGIVCGDISSSGDMIEGLATHSRIDDCITKQKQFGEEIVNLGSQLKVRMGQARKVCFQIRLYRDLLITRSRLLTNNVFPSGKLQYPRRRTYSKLSKIMKELLMNKSSSGLRNWKKPIRRTTSLVTPISIICIPWGPLSASRT